MGMGKMTKDEFLKGFQDDFLFEPATTITLENLKRYIFEYIITNSKLEMSHNSGAFVLTMPYITRLFTPDCEKEISHNLVISELI